jgi:hypothetical protein
MRRVQFLFVMLTILAQGVEGVSVPNPVPNFQCSSWTFSENLGGLTLSEPAMEFWNNRYVIVVRGGDNSLWVKEWNNGMVKDWYNIGGQTPDSPKLVIENNGLWLYVKGGGKPSTKSNILAKGCGMIG